VPWLAGLLGNQFVRGGISGIGVVTVLAGLRDLAGAILARHAARLDVDGPAGPSTS
jgi:hypothetical protein